MSAAGRRTTRKQEPDMTELRADAGRKADPYKRGYKTPRELRKVIAQAHRTRLLRTTVTAVVDHLSIPAALLIATSPAVRQRGAVSIAVAGTAAVLISARQFR